MVLVDDLEGGQPFERHIALLGAVNFRDLGGYRTADGRRTRWRTLFRADGLSSLETSDLQVIRELGITTVIDLRTSAELERGRFPVETVPVDYHHLPLLDEVPDPDSFALTPGMLATQYQDMVRDAAPQIAGALTIVARQQSHPLVVHCAAGKDRTGVLVAVLLGLLGVPDETIVADYALSAQAMGALRRKLIKRYPEGEDVISRADELFSAAPSNIESLLAELDRRFGSIPAYGESIGIGPAVVTQLQNILLEPAA
jgi:protein-tyrosine phosphatase